MNMYQQHIMEHYGRPSNYGEVKDCTHQHTDHNPLCGDEVTIQVRVEGEKIAAVGFTSIGCAISKASTSMLTEHINGKTVAEVKTLQNQDMMELLSIPISPSRVKCALLGLVAIKKALYGVENAKD
ncbi:SUF system NifU family Fe-S cluster assembly protein [Candidatus Woesearchaeota archaeon]|nr:SUF system NifU family Fe-S cluster assembly protein [Candidatus Woesearchaeota archaeon]|tara:strand:+ start:994 stop:1371 length:378 start_codon:yes stop_codon:yes gene_type:complete